MSDQKGSNSFLNRWSARKQQSTRSVDSDSAAEPGIDTELPDLTDSAVFISETAGRDTLEPYEDALPVEAAEALLTDADMPAVDTLTASSDLRGFFSKGVSTALRKAALRHVFQQPKYNVRDGLDDYDGDYTSFEPLGDTVTADMKFHAARKERARVEAERLAEEQLPPAGDMPDSEDGVTSQESQADDLDHEDQPDAVVTMEEDAGNTAALPHEQPQDQTSATNKPAQSTTSQPYETPNE